MAINVEVQSATIDVLEKNRNLDVKLHVEANADGTPRVHQVHENGTYIPADDSEFQRTSAAAAEFVARTLASRHGASVSTDVNESNTGPTVQELAADSNIDPDWASSAVNHGERATYEAGRLVAVLEALRVGNEPENRNPILQFRRISNPALSRQRTGAEASIPSATLKEAPYTIMAKKRSLAKCAKMLKDSATSMRKWVKDDNEFSAAFHYLRTKACGVRRSSVSGAPLIDVGDGHFTEVRRVSDEDKRCLVRVNTPSNVFLSIGLERLELDCVPVAAPVVQADVNAEGEIAAIDCLEAVLRRIRLARVSAFRERTFERMTREATEMTDAVDFTTNSISVESGPYDVLRIDRTLRQIAPNLNAGAKLDGDEIPNFRKVQDASLLQMVMLHQSISTLQIPKEAVKQGKGVFDRALITTCALSLLRALEKVLDDVVSLLGVRVEWARGGNRPEEARAFIYSDDADGDGPTRLLLSVEPLSTKNNAGNACTSGHVKLTPAFGVIIPAPDDPNARGRAAVLMAPSSSSAGGAPTILFDDVPRSYVCPVHSGSEVIATVTLLLCIRLLDALEMAARAGEAEVLDVDRQCFMVVVSSPLSGRVLRVKVWPKGTTPGREVPATSAWLNGKLVEDFPTTAPGRLEAWKRLLKRLVSSNVQSNGLARNRTLLPNRPQTSSTNGATMNIVN